mmetsp:Transcript_17858/g.22693  ORF Transcript_17858/g.22693 Transcript_17858/m.22693 type:complete len:439 (-) Transcript_17858:72-1388(-)
MASTLPPGSPKGILIKPGTPRSNRRNNVNFSSDVVLIGKGKNIPLQAPASTNDELTFEYNPPANTASVASYAKPSGGRAGTMRVKGPAVMGGKGAKKSVMSLYGPPEPKKEEVKREPAVIEGYLKLLKQTGMKSTWLKRYVALTNTSIAYYKAADSPKALKEIAITADCYVREISQKAGVTNCQNALELSYDRKNSIVLKGSSQREATEWITSICTVVDAMTGDIDDDEFEFVDEDEFEEIEPTTTTKKDSDPFSAPISSTSKSGNLEPQVEQEEFYFYDEDEDEFEFVEVSPRDAKKAEASKREEEQKQKEEAERARKEEEEAKKKKQQQEADRMAAVRKAEEEAKKKQKENEAKRRQEEQKRAQEKLNREKQFKPASTGSPSVIKSTPYSAASGNSPKRPVQATPKYGATGAMKSVGTPAKASNRVGNLMKLFEKP